MSAASTPFVLAGAATMVVVLGGFRPARPARVRRPVGRASGPPRARRRAQARSRMLVGLLLLAALVDPVLAALAGAALWLGSRWRRVRRARGTDRRAVETELPELIDLVALASAAGLTVPDALRAAAPCAPPATRADVVRAVEAIDTGARIEQALDLLRSSWGDAGRPFVHALVDHARYGTPLLGALERVGADARTRRRRAAETRARQLPVLLLFPLVLCTLPAFGLLTVAPLVAGTLGSLDGSPLEAPASTAP